MRIRQRKFTGDADIQAMIALAHAAPSSQIHLVEQIHLVDLPYRLSSWALDEPDNVALWVDDQNRLAAWAVLQTPFWTIDSVCQPGLGTDFYDRILDWANQRAQEVAGTRFGRPSWFVNTYADRGDTIRTLEAAGFTCQSGPGEDAWSQVLMSRPSQTPLPTHPLPAGFIIRPLAGPGEVSAYVALHQAAFESKNMSEPWRLKTLQQPAYAPSLDLVAAAPGGQLAAFCIGWYDPDLRWGQIEPMGVGEPYRGQGLGRAILEECLRRMVEMGAEQILVMPDDRSDACRLYERVGFGRVKDVLVFRKDYE